MNKTNKGKYFQYVENTNSSLSQGFIIFKKEDETKNYLLFRGLLSVIKFKYINLKNKIKKVLTKRREK